MQGGGPGFESLCLHQKFMTEFYDNTSREMAREIKYGLSPLEAMTDDELKVELKRAESYLLELELVAIATGHSTPDQLAEEAIVSQRIWDSI